MTEYEIIKIQVVFDIALSQNPKIYRNLCFRQSFMNTFLGFYDPNNQLDKTQIQNAERMFNTYYSYLVR